MAKADSGKSKIQHKNQDDFKSVAKRLECDDDKARFEAKMGRLAKSPASKGQIK